MKKVVFKLWTEDYTSNLGLLTDSSVRIMLLKTWQNLDLQHKNDKQKLQVLAKKNIYTKITFLI